MDILQIRVGVSFRTAPTHDSFRSGANGRRQLGCHDNLNVGMMVGQILSSIGPKGKDGSGLWCACDSSDFCHALERS